MAFIIIVTILIYILAIICTWHNLGQIEKNKKLLIIVISFLIVYLITKIVFAISKGAIQYTDINIEKSIKDILVAIFTGINSLLVLPFVANLLNKANNKEIEKEKLLKKLIIIFVIFIICMFFECGYMSDTQKGILKFYNYSSH